jgi:nucleolin
MASDDAKLFVAGLPDSVSEDVLRQLFEATGGQVVSVSIPKDRTTGRPRGFGFVTMSSPEEAKVAREALDGSLQAGRSISVRPFQADPPRGDAPREGGGFRGEGGGFRSGPRGDGPGRGGPPPQDRTLYVGNLPYDTSQEEIASLVNGVSENGVVRVNLPMDPDGRKRGFGFVTLSSSEGAKTAAEALASAELRGRRLIVNIAHPKGDRPAREGGDFGGGGGRDFGGPPRDFGGPPRDFGGPPRDFGGGPPRDFGGGPPRDFGGPPRAPAKNDRRRGGGAPGGSDDGFRKPRGGAGGGGGGGGGRGGRGRDYDDWDDE